MVPNDPGVRPSRVEVSITTETINGDEPVQLRAVGSGPFGLGINAEIVALAAGATAQDALEREILRATPASGDAWVVEASVRGWLAWRVDRVTTKRGRTVEIEYSQRSYPYISSRLVGRLRIYEGELTAVGIEVGEGIRPLRRYPLWVKDEHGDDAEGEQARTRGGWIWRFHWPTASPRCWAQFQLPLTTGAPTLASLVGSVAYSLLLTGIVMPATVQLGPPSAVAGVVAAALAVMLARWAAADRPHHLTLLTGIYALAALVTVAWAVAAEAGEAWLLVGAAPFSLGGGLLWLNAYFEAVGGLPRRIARPWTALSTWLHFRRIKVRDRLRNRSGGWSDQLFRPGGWNEDKAAKTALMDQRARQPGGASSDCEGDSKEQQ